MTGRLQRLHLPARAGERQPVPQPGGIKPGGLEIERSLRSALAGEGQLAVRAGQAQVVHPPERSPGHWRGRGELPDGLTGRGEQQLVQPQALTIELAGEFERGVAGLGGGGNIQPGPHTLPGGVNDERMQWRPVHPVERERTLVTRGSERALRGGGELRLLPAGTGRQPVAERRRREFGRERTTGQFPGLPVDGSVGGKGTVVVPLYLQCGQFHQRPRQRAANLGGLDGNIVEEHIAEFEFKNLPGRGGVTRHRDGAVNFAARLEPRHPGQVSLNAELGRGASERTIQAEGDRRAQSGRGKRRVDQQGGQREFTQIAVRGGAGCKRLGLGVGGGLGFGVDRQIKGTVAPDQLSPADYLHIRHAQFHAGGRQAPVFRHRGGFGGQPAFRGKPAREFQRLIPDDRLSFDFRSRPDEVQAGFVPIGLGRQHDRSIHARRQREVELSSGKMEAVDDEGGIVPVGAGDRDGQLETPQFPGGKLQAWQPEDQAGSDLPGQCLQAGQAVDGFLSRVRRGFRCGSLQLPAVGGDGRFGSAQPLPKPH